MFNRKKLIFLTVFVLFVLGSGYFLFSPQHKNTSRKSAQEQNAGNEEETQADLSGSPQNRQKDSTKRTTLEGRADCIPLRDTAAVQTECIFGLRTASGEYYVLDTNLMASTPPLYDVDDRITVTGIITPIEYLSTDKWRKYQVKGIFSVTDAFEKQ